MLKRLTDHTRESVRLSDGWLSFAVRVLLAALIGYSVWQPHGAPWYALAAIWIVMPAGSGPRRAEAGAVVLLAYYLASARAIAASLAGFLHQPLAIGWVYAGCWALLMASPWLVVGTVSRRQLRALAKTLRLPVKARLPGLDHPPGPACTATIEVLRWASYLTLVTVPPLGAFGLMPLSAAAISTAPFFANIIPQLSAPLQFVSANVALLAMAACVRLLIAYSEDYVGLWVAKRVGRACNERTFTCEAMIELMRMPCVFLGVATALCILIVGSTALAGPGVNTKQSLTTTALRHDKHRDLFSGAADVLGLKTRIPASVDEALHRYAGTGALLKSMRLALALRQAVHDHPQATVIATPEFAAGNLCHYPHVAQPLYAFWARHPGLTLMIGARIPRTHDSSACTDGVLVLSRAGLTTIEAGQPAPLSEWKPWSGKASFPTHWWQQSIARIPRIGRVATLVCYDGAIAWFPMLDALAHPAFMVSVQGHRWRYGHWVAAIQHRLVRGWARFYHTPIVIADAQLGPDSLLAGKKKGAPRKSVMPLMLSPSRD